MLHEFLKVAYEHDAAKKQSIKLSSDLKRLPNEQLYALATGKAKLAFGHESSEEWLEKFKGTELFDQALALEKSDLENEVARSQASAAQPQMDQFWKTQDHIRIQKKMLDLQLVEHMEGGAPVADGGKLPDVVPTAQGAGALGDMAAEGASDGAIGMQGKTGSVKEAYTPAIVPIAGLAASHQLGKRRGLEHGDDSGGTRGLIGGGAGGLIGSTGGAMLGHALGGGSGADLGGLIGGVGGNILGYRAAMKKYDDLDEKEHGKKKESAANFQKAATRMSAINAGGYGGAALGGLAGAAHGFKKDEEGNRHILRGVAETAGGAILGNTLGAAGADVHHGMTQRGLGMGAALKAHGTDVYGDAARYGGHFKHKFSSADLEKAALNMASAVNFARKNPALVGAGIGAVGGALTASRDPQTGEKHYIRGALGGAALGGAVGHAAGGISNRMTKAPIEGVANSGKGMGFHDAVKSYGSDTYNAAANKVLDVKQRYAPTGGSVASGNGQRAQVHSPAGTVNGPVSSSAGASAAGNVAGPGGASKVSPKAGPQAAYGGVGRESANSGKTMAEMGLE